MLEGCKTQLKNKVMLLLAGSLDKDIEIKSKEQIVFLEKWIIHLSCDKVLIKLSSEFLL